MTALPLALGAGDWLHLFLYYLSLSLLAVGGAIATAPDMHRFLVERQAWLTDPQFSASIAIAQAAPGPNVLFVALLGWNVGVNAGGPGLAGWLLAVLPVPPRQMMKWSIRHNLKRLILNMDACVSLFGVPSVILRKTSLKIWRNVVEEWGA